MDCSLPGSSVHRILQARILEWVAIPFSANLSNPRIKPRFPALQADSRQISSIADFQHCRLRQISSIAAQIASWATRKVPFWYLHSDGNVKLYHFTFLPETHNGSNFSMFSSILVIFWILHTGHPKGHKIVFHRGFFLIKIIYQIHSALNFPTFL